MLDKTKDLLKKTYGFKDKTLELYEAALKDIEGQFQFYDEIREFNQIKVLNAFQEERISDSHFTNSTGYGYDDIGRDGLDKVYARIFKTESAIVRPHFVNGTHAIGSALFGNLRPGDTLLCASGRPYDTLHNVIGLDETKKVGSLREYGVKYKEVPLIQGKFNFDGIREALDDNSIKIVHLQRSPGYSYRRAFLVSELEEVIKFIKDIRNDVIVFIDNCYGEFIDTIEPTEIGADLMAGSLIKNIGGGISPSGGYIVGKEDLVTQSAYRLTVPGIGGECGATFGLMRTMFQGLFLAPHVAIEALKGAVFCARIMTLAGYEVLPKYDEKRSDIIQTIKFGNPEDVINFCKGIQYGSPIDSYVECEPWEMPGYEDKVIMASGSFIQGSSIELSADAPMREPYIAFLQGGLTFDQAKIGILIALNNIVK